jgi:hypothetical protein
MSQGLSYCLPRGAGDSIIRCLDRFGQFLHVRVLLGLPPGASDVSQPECNLDSASCTSQAFADLLSPECVRKFVNRQWILTCKPLVRPLVIHV